MNELIIPETRIKEVRLYTDGCCDKFSSNFDHKTHDSDTFITRYLSSSCVLKEIDWERYVAGRDVTARLAREHRKDSFHHELARLCLTANANAVYVSLWYSPLPGNWIQHEGIKYIPEVRYDAA